MKRITYHRYWVAAIALIGLVAVATPGFACWGYGPGYGRTGTAAQASTLTDAQQKQVNAVQSKYQPQLNDLQKKLNAKFSELAEARSKDSTTVAQLKALQGSIFQLENRYRALLDQANAEIARIPGVDSSQYFPCSYNGMPGYRGYGMPGGYMGRMMYGGYNRDGASGYATPCSW